MYTTIKQKGVEDPSQYWMDIKLLSNKFEPFESFATEQGIYELKLANLQEKYQDLKSKLTDLDIRTA